MKLGRVLHEPQEGLAEKRRADLFVGLHIVDQLHPTQIELVQLIVAKPLEPHDVLNRENHGHRCIGLQILGKHPNELSASEEAALTV
eukprot:6632348-Alexandrium_andersonii.AAC.1